MAKCDHVDFCPYCSEVAESRRKSLENEIRNGLMLRGLWSPKSGADLITAVFKAIDTKPELD